MHGTVCYLYYFTCGSYLGWAFWPNHPFFGYSWIQCFLGKLPEDPLGVPGIRYSAMRIYGVDWLRCESGLLGGEISETWGMGVAEDRALGRVFSQCRQAGVTWVE